MSFLIQGTTFKDFKNLNLYLLHNNVNTPLWLKSRLKIVLEYPEALLGRNY